MTGKASKEIEILQQLFREAKKKTEVHMDAILQDRPKDLREQDEEDYLISVAGNIDGELKNLIELNHQ